MTEDLLNRIRELELKNKLLFDLIKTQGKLMNECCFNCHTGDLKKFKFYYKKCETLRKKLKR